MSTDANTPANSQLGRETAYPEHYDASLLFPIPRRSARAEIGLREAALPFTGHDRWHAYEISWLDPLGKPQAATATFTVAANSPNLIESKSFKLYLNSLNQSVWTSTETLRQQIETDLSAVAASAVTMQWGLPPLEEDTRPPRHNIDSLPIAIEDYGPPNPAHLSADPSDVVTETLHSALLKSNCPVTGQPDWASLHLHYRGPRIDPAGLLRYLVSFRNHREFHEQCVERIFVEVLARCAPEALSVEARYTRRGGLDINPWRATPGLPAPTALRDARQ